ncbi:MAG: hypothetical protein ACYS3S_02175 [Planctomycetota bacterium]
MRSILLMLIVAATLGIAHAETYWTNGTFTGNWSDANNWDDGLPSGGDDAIIENPAVLTWPRLDGGTGECKQLRIAYNPDMLGELTVAGGAILNVHDDLRISRKSPGGEVGTLYISDPGTCIIGREDIEVGRYGNATIEMSGGYLCTADDGYLNLAYRAGSFGTIYLRSGTIETGTGGLTVGNNQSDIGTALIDIYDGVLIIAGDAVSDVNAYIDEGVIVAFDGERDVLVEFDGSRTIVRAYPGINMPPNIGVGGLERIVWPDSNSIRLDATVTDDDPCGLGPLILRWSVLSSPAEAGVVFHPSNDIQDPCAIFSEPGAYELLLQARDRGTNESAPLEAIALVNVVVERNQTISSNSSFIVTRLNDKEPIITEAMFEAVGAIRKNGAGMTEGENINGPSLLRIPDWIAPENRADPNAVYYLYFAHHRGDYIRMAWAEYLEGLWRLYNVGAGVPLDNRGVLSFNSNDKIDIGNDITIENHIASPDVFADDVNERIVMYFHGPSEQDGSSKSQSSFVAISPYGLDFNGGVEPVILGGSYFRVFEYGGNLYAFDNGGDLYMAPDANDPWTPPDSFDFGDDLWDTSSNDPFADDLAEAGFDGTLRHTAVRLIGDTLQVFYSRKYDDRPERIMMSTIDLSVGDYDLWDSSYPPEEILQAEPGWEGGQFRAEPSSGGHAPENVNQLRDPYIFEDIDGALYLFYSGCGEDAIGLALLQPILPGDFEIAKENRKR